MQQTIVTVLLLVIEVLHGKRFRIIYFLISQYKKIRKSRHNTLIKKILHTQQLYPYHHEYTVIRMRLYVVVMRSFA